MCGLTGFWSFSVDDHTVIAREMAEAITHRGPDDTGVWVDTDAGIALAHQRLSIMDLSPAGHQPMISACGRYVLVFNGEIYNHLNIRKQLDSAVSPSMTSAQEVRRDDKSDQGVDRHGLRPRDDKENLDDRDYGDDISTHGDDDNYVDCDEGINSQKSVIASAAKQSRGSSEKSVNTSTAKQSRGSDTNSFSSDEIINWRGHSDTETLLVAIQYWGMEKTLKSLNGMFAFALWDRKTRSLTLARDRMGEKPLYYGLSGQSFLFGSELKALVKHPEWRGEIDRNVMTLFMRHSYIPDPWSIYKGIYKLPPAHFVTIEAGGKQVSEPKAYWDLNAVVESGVNTNSANEQDLADELDNLLRDAVGIRMAADVPLGAFLSGGYDSTMVVAQMQAQSNRPVKTFTIGFHEHGYNEATHAKAVASHLGTDHTELYLTPEDAMAVIPKLPTIYDEPFADSSQIPTYLVSQLARQHVTVSLSGDGGDELFFGYGRYFKAIQLWQKINRLPPPIRKLAAGLLMSVPSVQLEKLMQFFPQALRLNHLSDRLPKIAEILRHGSVEAFYRDLVSHWKNPQTLVIGGSEPATIFSKLEQHPDMPGMQELMMYLDMVTYLPGDILTKVDRASMAVSLEARVPMLDHRLVEFAWRVPTAFKYRDGQGKWLLRQVLNRYVPETLMNRPKMGFGVPIEDWLKGGLRDWAEALLDENRLRQEGYFDPAPIRKMWHEHLSGKRRWHYYLWDVLMFQAWLETSK